jgi:hypothetical protein
MPPHAMLETLTGGEFLPAPDVAEWLMATFIREGGPLHNPEHAHLALARIGVLWTTVPAVRQMRRIVGQAEIPQARGNPWAKARQEYQIEQWFGGEIPDFLLTFDARWWAEIDDASCCALAEHELYHCAQAQGKAGPRFRRDGTPVWAIRGHDAEEFVGVVRRYGAGAAAGGVRELVEAVRRPPEVTAAQIAAACGVCVARVA